MFASNYAFSADWQGFYVHTDSSNGKRTLAYDISCKSSKCDIRLINYDQNGKEEPVFMGSAPQAMPNRGALVNQIKVTETLKNAVLNVHAGGELPRAAKEFYDQVKEPSLLRECKGHQTQESSFPIVVCRLTAAKLKLSDSSRSTEWFAVLPDLCTNSCCPNGLCLMPLLKTRRP